MKAMLQKSLTILLLITLLPLTAFVFQSNNKNGRRFNIYDKTWQKTLQLSAKEYVLGALCCEMPPTFHSQALIAQAVAIYTNALRSQSAGEDIVTTAESGKYIGYAAPEQFQDRWGKRYTQYRQKMCNAVEQALYKVITYDGKPILAAYHAMSGGKTEAAENVWGQAVPYLTAVESEGDLFCSQYETIVTLPIQKAREMLTNAYENIKLPENDAQLLTQIETSPSGTVLQVMTGNTKIRGQQLRTLFSLRSAVFTVSVSDGQLTFTVHGYGHGVGLSQYGADFMARQGADYRAILAHYYSGTELMQS